MNKGKSDEGFTSILPSIFFQCNSYGHHVVLTRPFEEGLESSYERTAVLLKKDWGKLGLSITDTR
jgi:hypothetical protein